MTTGYGIPWHHAGRRVLHNPFEVFGQQYCMRCKEWGSAQEEHRYEGKVFANKQWCKKCGTIISYSVYDGGGDADQLRRATEWATSREPITVR